MIAEFIHFYPGYTVESVLSMFARTFYAMVAAMHRIRGRENQEAAYRYAVANHGGEPLKTYLHDNEKLAGGAHAILREVEVIKNVQKRR